MSSDVKYRLVRDNSNYRVGDDGTLWSLGPNTRHTKSDGEWHQVIGKRDKDGYINVILSDKGRRKYVRLAALVLEAFVGPKPGPQYTAAHDNNVRHDNKLTNLRWATQKDNIADKKRHGTHQSGEKHPKSKLSWDKVEYIRNTDLTFALSKKLAAKFKVAVSTIWAAYYGYNWKQPSIVLVKN